MDWFRLKHTLALYMTFSSVKRAEYIKKHNIFRHMGDNCMVMFRKIPLYPELISFQDNVWIASNVTFVTHDVIHAMLNGRSGDKKYTEHVGCIDIRENVFVGANSTILSNVTIGPDVIVGAGSLVNKNLVSGVYVGVPAKYICSIEEFIEKKDDFPITHGKNGLSEETIEVCWERFKSKI